MSDKGSPSDPFGRSDRTIIKPNPAGRRAPPPSRPDPQPVSSGYPAPPASPHGYGPSTAPQYPSGAAGSPGVPGTGEEWLSAPPPRPTAASPPGHVPQALPRREQMLTPNANPMLKAAGPLLLLLGGRLLRFTPIGGRAGIEVDPGPPRILKPQTGTRRAVGRGCRLQARLPEPVLEGVLVAGTDDERDVMHAFLRTAGQHEDLVLAAARTAQSERAAAIGALVTAVIIAAFIQYGVTAGAVGLLSGSTVAMLIRAWAIYDRPPSKTRTIRQTTP